MGEEKKKGREEHRNLSNTSKWEAWQAFLLLLQPMGIPIKHVLSLLLSFVFHWVLFILWLHSVKFCSWMGEGGAELSSHPPLDFADCSWEVSLESPQKFPVFSLPNKSKMGQTFQQSPPVRATMRLWDSFVQMWRKATHLADELDKGTTLGRHSHWLPPWPPQPGRISAVLTLAAGHHYCYF